MGVHRWLGGTSGRYLRRSGAAQGASIAAACPTRREVPGVVWGAGLASPVGSQVVRPDRPAPGALARGVLAAERDRPHMGDRPDQHEKHEKHAQMVLKFRLARSVRR